MSFLGLRLDHNSEGASNFCGWKDRVYVVLEDYGVI